MNIALVTNKKYHHKYWVTEMYKKHNVSLIIHPIGIKKSQLRKFQEKRPFYFGPLNFILKLMSLIYGKISSKGLVKSIQIAEGSYFSDYEKEYEKISKPKISEVDTVNSEMAINLIKDNNIDVICFLGGDIAYKEFINSAKLCLNYHNGISPFYNGNKTNFHAVSDFRPNFTGGTLMKMNERIDGGEILMHYLCPIGETDKAADLYMKGIIGAVKTYNRFLDRLQLDVFGVEQKRSIKFLRNIDWVITNDIRLNRFYKYDRMKIYKREEQIIDYTEKEYSIKELYGIALKEILG